MTASIAQLGNVPAKNKTATQVVLDAAAAHGIHLNQVFGVGGGDHADGFATDFMVYSDKAAGDWIADYLWENRVRLGVRWIIWQQRIRSTSPGKPGTWQAMEDRGSPTQNHRDHVHVKWYETPVQALAQAVTDVASSVTGIYTVQAGDTVAAIASRFRVTIANIVSWNGLANANIIQIGQKLRIRAAAPAPKPTTAKPIPAPPRWFATNELLNDENLRLHTTSTTARIYNPKVWSWLYWQGGADGRAFCQSHYAAWMNESSSVFGPTTLAATQEVYRILNKRDRAHWPDSQTVNPRPTWPGAGVLRVLGFRAD